MARNVCDKIRDWGNRPMGLRAFYAMVAAIGVISLLRLVACSVYDFDMYWMIATGREVVRGGIPTEHPWSVDGGLGFVAQQWAYSVVLYWASLCGPHAGFFFLVCAELAVLFAVLYVLFRLDSVGNVQFALSVAVLCMLSQSYMFSVRPELVTMVLMSLECLGIEMAVRRDRPAWLVLLPVSMVLEMNLHASMWPFHYCIVLAYAVPAFWMPGTDEGLSRGARRHWRNLAAGVASMTAVMPLNAYGMDGVLYVLRSFRAGTFDLVDIVEMREPEVFSNVGVAMVICLCFVFVCHKLKSLSSHSMNMLAGFGLLSMLAVRNNMFMVFPAAFLLRDLCRGIVGLSFRIDWKKDVRNYFIPLFSIVLVFVSFRLASGIANMVDPDDYDFVDALDGICDYIEAEDGTGSRVFTGFNTGAYLEYRDFRNIYVDARPEIYTAALNGTKDVLAEYSRYCLYGTTMKYKKTMPERWRCPVSGEEMGAWLDGYGFDYVIVMPSVEMHLAGYLTGSTDYELVPEYCSRDVLLYHRTGEVTGA